MLAKPALERSGEDRILVCSERHNGIMKHENFPQNAYDSTRLDPQSPQTRLLTDSPCIPQPAREAGLLYIPRASGKIKHTRLGLAMSTSVIRA